MNGTASNRFEVHDVYNWKSVRDDFYIHKISTGSCQDLSTILFSPGGREVLEAVGGQDILNSFCRKIERPLWNMKQSLNEKWRTHSLGSAPALSTFMFRLDDFITQFPENLFGNFPIRAVNWFRREMFGWQRGKVPQFLRLPVREWDIRWSRTRDESVVMANLRAVYRRSPISEEASQRYASMKLQKLMAFLIDVCLYLCLESFVFTPPNKLLGRGPGPIKRYNYDFSTILSPVYSETNSNTEVSVTPLVFSEDEEHHDDEDRCWGGCTCNDCDPYPWSAADESATQSDSDLYFASPSPLSGTSSQQSSAADFKKLRKFDAASTYPHPDRPKPNSLASSAISQPNFSTQHRATLRDAVADAAKRPNLSISSSFPKPRVTSTTSLSSQDLPVAPQRFPRLSDPAHRGESSGPAVPSSNSLPLPNKGRPNPDGLSGSDAVLDHILHGISSREKIPRIGSKNTAVSCLKTSREDDSERTTKSLAALLTASSALTDSDTSTPLKVPRAFTIPRKSTSPAITTGATELSTSLTRAASPGVSQPSEAVFKKSTSKKSSSARASRAEKEHREKLSRSRQINNDKVTNRKSKSKEIDGPGETSSQQHVKQPKKSIGKSHSERKAPLTAVNPLPHRSSSIVNDVNKRITRAEKNSKASLDVNRNPLPPRSRQSIINKWITKAKKSLKANTVRRFEGRKAGKVSKRRAISRLARRTSFLSVARRRLAARKKSLSTVTAMSTEVTEDDERTPAGSDPSAANPDDFQVTKAGKKTPSPTQILSDSSYDDSLPPSPVLTRSQRRLMEAKPERSGGSGRKTNRKSTVRTRKTPSRGMKPLAKANSSYGLRPRRTRSYGEVSPSPSSSDSECYDMPEVRVRKQKNKKRTTFNSNRFRILSDDDEEAEETGSDVEKRSDEQQRTAGCAASGDTSESVKAGIDSGHIPDPNIEDDTIVNESSNQAPDRGGSPSPAQPTVDRDNRRSDVDETGEFLASETQATDLSPLFHPPPTDANAPSHPHFFVPMADICQLFQPLTGPSELTASGNAPSSILIPTTAVKTEAPEVECDEPVDVSLPTTVRPPVETVTPLPPPTATASPLPLIVKEQSITTYDNIQIDAQERPQSDTAVAIMKEEIIEEEEHIPELGAPTSELTPANGDSSPTAVIFVKPQPIEHEHDVDVVLSPTPPTPQLQKPASPARSYIEISDDDDVPLESTGSSVNSRPVASATPVKSEIAAAISSPIGNPPPPTMAVQSPGPKLAHKRSSDATPESTVNKKPCLPIVAQEKKAEVADDEWKSSVDMLNADKTVSALFKFMYLQLVAENRQLRVSLGVTSADQIIAADTSDVADEITSSLTIVGNDPKLAMMYKWGIKELAREVRQLRMMVAAAQKAE